MAIKNCFNKKCAYRNWPKAISRLHHKQVVWTNTPIFLSLFNVLINRNNTVHNIQIVKKVKKKYYLECDMQIIKLFEKKYYVQ